MRAPLGPGRILRDRAVEHQRGAVPTSARRAAAKAIVQPSDKGRIATVRIVVASSVNTTDIYDLQPRRPANPWPACRSRHPQTAATKPGRWSEGRRLWPAAGTARRSGNPLRTALSATWMQNSNQKAHERSWPTCLGGDGLRVTSPPTAAWRRSRLRRPSLERGNHHHLTATERGGDQGKRTRQRHLADSSSGEVVGAQCGARAQAGIGAGDEGRGNRMLRAAAQPSEYQARDHAP